MGWSFKIGSVRGIDIKIHFTFFLIVFWAAGQGAAGLGGIHGALFAVISILLLFGCVTLHELGHSLVAIRLGLRVKDITLLPIGGLAQLETMSEKPLDELLIAVAGPAVNVAIVIGLAPLVLLLRGSDVLLDPASLSQLMMGSRSLLALLLYLLSANVILALFNLIPAFPMDGGRVLRAFLAFWTSYPRATRIAARVGQAMAVGLALLALTPFFGFSLILVALFVFTGASYEDQMVQMRSATQGMHVRQAMPVRPFLSVAPDYSLTEVLELGQRAGQRDFPVAKDGALVGLLLRDDLLSAFRLEGGHVRVTQIMHHEFPIVSTDDPLLRAQQLMAQSNLSALPVFDHGALIGLISLEDINRAYAYLSWRQR